MDNETLTRLREYKSFIEGFLSLEKRALNGFKKPAQDDERGWVKYTEFTEPIARTITAYETCLGNLEERFPELKG